MNDELRTQYWGLRNWVTEEVRRAKSSYYSDLFYGSESRTVNPIGSL